MKTYFLFRPLIIIHNINMDVLIAHFLHLSKDLRDEVDVSSGAGQYSSDHLHVRQLLFIHGAQWGGAGLPLCQCRCVWVALFRFTHSPWAETHAASSWSRWAAAPVQVVVRANTTPAAVVRAACRASSQSGCCSLEVKRRVRHCHKTNRSYIVVHFRYVFPYLINWLNPDSSI